MQLGNEGMKEAGTQETRIGIRKGGKQETISQNGLPQFNRQVFRRLSLE